MLQKLIFKFDDNKITNPEARGSLTQEFSDDPSETIITINPEHQFNKRYGFEESIAYYVKELEPGIYLGGFNFEHTVEMLTNFKTVYQHGMNRDGSPYKLIYHDGNNKEARDHNYNILMNSISKYGVADNIEQVKEHFKEAIAHPTNRIVISITPVRREDQPEDGGWRWHKWGEYIGEKNPTTEYLYDESEIDEVIVFHAYMVKETK